MKRSISPYLTSYDFLKTLAVLLMVVDHVGYYFYPDMLWFRVVGRLCVPMWFFLIGYARSRDLSPRLWIGATILIAADIFLGRDIFPLNILVSILCVRLILDKIPWGRDKTVSSALSGLVLLLLVIPTYFWTEYGTLAIILALFGKTVRQGDKDTVFYTLVFSLFGFVLMQQAFFGFNALQFYMVVIGLFCVFMALLFFRPQSYKNLTNKLPQPLVWAFQLGGRRTLEIYVFHLLVFKVWAFYLVH